MHDKPGIDLYTEQEAKIADLEKLVVATADRLRWWEREGMRAERDEDDAEEDIWAVWLRNGRIYVGPGFLGALGVAYEAEHSPDPFHTPT